MTFRPTASEYPRYAQWRQDCELAAALIRFARLGEDLLPPQGEQIANAELVEGLRLLREFVTYMGYYQHPYYLADSGEYVDFNGQVYRLTTEGHLVPV